MPQQAPGQSHREGPTLVQVIAKFGDEESAEHRFTERLCPSPRPAARIGTCKTCGHRDRTGDGGGRCLMDGMGCVTYPDDGCVEWRHRDGL